MKRIVLINLLVVIFINVHGQNKIEGIGPFKINKTPITIISDIVNKEGYKMINANLIKSLVTVPQRHEKVITEWFFSPKEERKFGPLANNIEGVRMFVVYNYNISGAKTLILYLIFQNDILIFLSCNATKDLEEALIIKYGPPQKKIEENGIICKDPLDDYETKLIDRIYTLSWTNERIDASLIASIIHDSICNEIHLFNFQICDKGKIEAIKLTQLQKSDSNKVKNKKPNLVDINSL